MNELERLQRAYDAIGEPTGDELAAARQALLAEIASADLKSLAGNGRPQPESSHGHRAYRHRRLGLIAVAAVILVGVLLVTPAFGIGSRLLDLLQSYPRPPEVQAPVWSPDGGRIAFLRRHARSNWEVTVVKADGSGQRVLARNGFFDAPAWSPDGRQIAFAGNRDGKPELYVVNADGSGKQQRLARRGYAPAWSPDGRKIAFASGAWVFVTNADRSGHQRLTPRRMGKFASLAWSPDGRELAFLESGEPFCFQIYVATADGSELRQLTFGRLVTSRTFVCHGDHSALAWSPDGQRLAFAIGTEHEHDPGPVPTFDSSGVYVMNADGSRKRRLTRSVELVRALAWSPDGRKLLFASEVVDFPNSGGEIYVVNADGGGRRNLTRDPAHDFAPAFSPDGRRIVFVSDRDGAPAVYVMNADGSGVRKLARPGS